MARFLVLLLAATAADWVAQDAFLGLRVALYAPNATAARGAACPLVLALHSRGAVGAADDDAQLGPGEPAYLFAAEPQPEATLVLAPRLSSGSWVDADARALSLVEAYANGSRAIPAGGCGAVDARRVYLTGHSMGAAGAWRLLDVAADGLFAAAGPVSSSAYDAAARLARTPQWVFASSGDETVDADRTLRTAEAVWAALGLGGAPDETSSDDLKWTVLDAPAHGQIPQFIRASRGPEVLAWVLSKSSRAAPPPKPREPGPSCGNWCWALLLALAVPGVVAIVVLLKTSPDLLCVLVRRGRRSSAPPVPDDCSKRGHAWLRRKSATPRAPGDVDLELQDAGAGDSRPSQVRESPATAAVC